MRIESNCQTGEIKYFDDAGNEIDPPVLEEANEPLPEDEPERARNADGTFIGDDPATPEVNEAWVDGGQE